MDLPPPLWPTPHAATIEAPIPSAEASRLVDASKEDLDAELLSIFLEEANQVLATIDEHLPLVHATSSEQAALATLRRSFHTLKGSGRMVGLTDLGETAWEVEQVLNVFLPYVLLYPERHFILTHNGRTLVDLPPAADIVDRTARALNLEARHLLAGEGAHSEECRQRHERKQAAE